MSTIAPRVLSQQDAATYIGKSVRQLQRYADRGDLTPVYLDSKPSYRREELDALIDAAPTERPVAS